MVEELDGHQVQRLEVDQLVGQGIVESTLHPPGVHASGQIEDGARHRGDRDAVEDGPVLRRQVSRLMEHAQARSAP